jgi:spermidine synthase
LCGDLFNTNLILAGHFNKDLRMKLLLTICIFTSSFLLFLIQPIIAKQIMPWFGGTSAVWTVCIMFFQFVLLLGYIYADLVTRFLKPRTTAIVHIALVLGAAYFLPIIPSETLKPDPTSLPVTEILVLLIATIGLPYFCLSTTGPLLQTWFTHYFPESKVYRLFALSNLASLIALLAYPFVIEPYCTSHEQSWWWTGGFCIFVALSTASAWICRNRMVLTGDEANIDNPNDFVGAKSTTTLQYPPSYLDYASWLVLSALGSILLLAVTNHITHNIASVPFLWLVPLSVYLLTFILCFDGKGWYKPKFFAGPLIFLPPLMAWGVYTNAKDISAIASVIIYAAGLFVCCMFYHGELNERKPKSRYLTRFYLSLSAGGALGGLLMSAVVPYVFDSYYEMPIALFATSILFLFLLKNYLTANKTAHVLLVLSVFSSLTTATVGWAYFVEQSRNSIVMLRNFYAVSRVTEFESKTTGTARVLKNGKIIHGMQILSDSKATTPTTYYGKTSGVGYALKSKQSMPKNVGVIGLGVGTLAAYGKNGDTFKFYEINPHSKQIAENDFTYLKKSAANIQIVMGDARLMLDAELKQGQRNNFDVLVIDAFSSDSIPVHLLTKEAIDIYRQHMKTDGVIAFHVSNIFLNLAPVVQQLAVAIGWKALYIIDPYKWPAYTSEWVLVFQEDDFLVKNSELKNISKPIAPISGLEMWSDGYNNLFKILKKKVLSNPA